MSEDEEENSRSIFHRLVSCINFNQEDRDLETLQKAKLLTSSSKYGYIVVGCKDSFYFGSVSDIPFPKLDEENGIVEINKKNVPPPQKLPFTKAPFDDILSIITIVDETIICVASEKKLHFYHHYNLFQKV